MARDLVANNLKDQGPLTTLAEDGNHHLGALGPLKHFRYFGGGEVVGGLVIHFGDHVTGTDAGSIGRRTHKRSHDNGLAAARSDRHAYAVIAPLLLFAQQGERLRIEEVGVRIQGPEHSRNRSVVDGLVFVDGIGVVGLYRIEYLGEQTEAVLDVGVGGRGGRPAWSSKPPAKQCAPYNHQACAQVQTSFASHGPEYAPPSRLLRACFYPKIIACRLGAWYHPPIWEILASRR